MDAVTPAAPLKAPQFKAVLHKGVPVEEDVLTLARARMRHVFALHDHVAVSLSGGKDSTVILNLALEVARELGRTPLRVVFFDEECIYSENIDYIRRVGAQPDVALEWYCLPVKHRNACSTDSPYWFPWAAEDREKWVRELPQEAITHLSGYDHADPAARKSIPEISGLLFAPELGNCAFILGIRADESMTRRRAVSFRTEDNYIVKHSQGYGGTGKVLGWGNLWKAYPIYDWRTPDVWLAPKLLGWDYCHVYDLMDKIGIKPNQQRLAPPFGEEPMQSLHQWHLIEPQLWFKMCARVPGAATAKRYARTELYAFGDLPQRPAGMTWEEFITETIRQKHQGAAAASVAKSVQKHIRAHFRKTSDPLGIKKEHPHTGMSWEFLLKIATRGDFKNRRQPKMGQKTDAQYVKDHAIYTAQLEQYGRDLARERAELAAEQEPS